MSEVTFKILAKQKLDQAEQERIQKELEQEQFMGGVKKTGRAFKKTFIPTKEELPEFIGSMGGMIARRTIPGMGIAGTLSAGGEAYRIAKSEKEKLLEKETPEKLGMAFLRGAGSEAVGRMVGGLIGRKGGTTPEMVETITKAEKEGFELPLSVRSKGGMQHFLESSIERSMFGEEVLRQKVKLVRDFADYAERVSGKIAKNIPDEELRIAATKKLAEYKSNFTITKNALYEKIPDTIRNKKIASPFLEVTDVLPEIVKRRGVAAKPSGFSLLRQTYLDLVSGKARPQTIQDLINIRSNLKSHLTSRDPAATGVQADLENVITAIEKDIADNLENVAPKYVELLKEADKFFAIGINKLKGELFDSLSTAEPSKLFKEVIDIKEPSLIQASKEFLGEDTFNLVKAQWLRDILQKSKIALPEISGKREPIFRIPQKTEKVDIFTPDPEKVLNELKKIEPIFDELFTTEQEKQAMDEFIRVANLLSESKIPDSIAKGFWDQVGSSLLAVIAKPIIDTPIARQFGRRAFSTGFPKTSFAVERGVQAVTEPQLQRIGERR